MRWRWTFGLLAFSAVAIPAGVYAKDFIAQDSCLDRGGAWYGTIGCVMEMPPVDRIVIDKSDRMLAAYAQGRLIRRLPIALGREPAGQKQREGDNRTPEGIYPITEHKADSDYHLALRLGYPTPHQAAEAQRKGVDPGGDIMIHGIRNGLGWIRTLHRRLDWTQGCIALTNGEVEWLFRSTADGVPVEIRP